jgi:chromosome partitioning protein
MPRNPDLRDAHSQKQDVFTSNAKSAAAQAYDKLLRELFDP